MDINGLSAAAGRIRMRRFVLIRMTEAYTYILRRSLTFFFPLRAIIYTERESFVLFYPRGLDVLRNVFFSVKASLRGINKRNCAHSVSP